MRIVARLRALAKGGRGGCFRDRSDKRSDKRKIRGSRTVVTWDIFFSYFPSFSLFLIRLNHSGFKGNFSAQYCFPIFFYIQESYVKDVKKMENDSKVRPILIFPINKQSEIRNALKALKDRKGTQ